MKHVSKFNENVGDNGVTYGDLLELVESDELKLINTSKTGVQKYIKALIELNLNRRNKDITNDPLRINRSGIIEIGEEYAFLPNEKVLIGEYELYNSFIFGDVVICPGHDSITCYNLNTGEHVRQYIR